MIATKHASSPEFGSQPLLLPTLSLNLTHPKTRTPHSLQLHPIPLHPRQPLLTTPSTWSKQVRGSQQTHHTRHSLLTMSNNSRRWCRWWYRTGKQSTLTPHLSNTHSLTPHSSPCPSSSRPPRTSTTSPSTTSSTPPVWPPIFPTSPPSPRLRASSLPTMASRRPSLALTSLSSLLAFPVSL